MVIDYLGEELVIDYLGEELIIIDYLREELIIIINYLIITLCRDFVLIDFFQELDFRGNTIKVHFLL